MKQFYSLVFILSVLLASCSVDEFSPCDDVQGMEGLLCKEFRFENSASIGYLTYYYNSEKQLSRIDYKAVDGGLKKYDILTYENGKISVIRSYDAEGKLMEEKEYKYDALSNLSNVSHIENGVEVAYKQFEYTDTLLQKESCFNYNQLENYTVYQYYNGETNIYRKSVYSASNELLSYTNIEYFVNNYERHNHYTGDHVFTGYDVYVFDANKNITRSSVYDFNGKLMSYIEYTYNASGQLDVSNQYDEDGKLRKNNKYIYHN